MTRERRGLARIAGAVFLAVLAAPIAGFGETRTYTLHSGPECTESQAAASFPKTACQALGKIGEQEHWGYDVTFGQQPVRTLTFRGKTGCQHIQVETAAPKSGCYPCGGAESSASWCFDAGS
ncbi:MAG: hypothetical protein WAM82_33365 [Thermoanaerobaculia bacterium]